MGYFIEFLKYIYLFPKFYKFIHIEMNRCKGHIVTQTMPELEFILGEDYIHPLSKKFYGKGTKLYDYDAHQFRPEGGLGGSSQFYEGIPHSVKHSPDINQYKRPSAYKLQFKDFIEK